MTFVEFLMQVYKLTVDEYFALSKKEQERLQEDYERKGYKGVVF